MHAYNHNISRGVCVVIVGCIHILFIWGHIYIRFIWFWYVLAHIFLVYLMLSYTIMVIYIGLSFKRGLQKVLNRIQFK